MNKERDSEDMSNLEKNGLETLASIAMKSQYDEKRMQDWESHQIETHSIIAQMEKRVSDLEGAISQLRGGPTESDNSASVAVNPEKPQQTSAYGPDAVANILAQLQGGGEGNG